jgi:hypothetical protein
MSSNNVPTTPYRSIVKDGYTTRDPANNSVEIAAWRIEEVTPEAEPPEEEEETIMTESGNLLYGKILRFALDELGADELARRTALKSYRDEQGGRAASTIRGYQYESDWVPPKEQGGYPSGHPMKRVLRRYARSRGEGHFEDDRSTAGDDDRDDEPQYGPVIGAEPIDIEEIKAMYRLARMIASKHGLVFVDDSGDGEPEEDNERIDHDEIRGFDRPTGETKAAAMVEKGDGSTFEYEIDLDRQSMERADGTEPPIGW